MALDISRQKKAQGDLITIQFRLAQQTQELEKAQEELKLLASTDPMTKLYNRRYFMQVSESLLSLAKREDRPISLMMLDIDKFKNINDTYGHKIGDEVIIKLSELLQEKSRKSDIVCRWGGEEFVILLPNTEIEGATIIAEKIREVVDSLALPVKEKEIHFSVSIGVSQFKNNSEINLEATINRADEALYEAKNSGRNRVCIAEYLKEKDGAE
jgi:diguanylate cyclase (GGDEF)-like protein